MSFDLNTIIGSLTFIFIVLNFIKLFEPTLDLNILGDSPSNIKVYYKNTSDKFIRDLKISYEFYVRDGYKIAGGTVVSDVVLAPGKNSEKAAYEEYPESERDAEFNRHRVVYCKLNYKYKFLYRFIVCGSYHFEWKNPVIAYDGIGIWTQELGKTRVKAWWQFWQQCPPPLSHTFEDLIELEKKEEIEFQKASNEAEALFNELFGELR